MTKLDYSKAYNKHKIREQAFNIFRSQSNIRDTKNIIGLAGPNFKEYVQNLNNKGFNNITLYENNNNVFLLQLNQIIQSNTKVIFDNINNSIINNKYLYDLDYCCTIDSIDFKYLSKIENYFLTLSVRGIGYEQTLIKYLSNENSKEYLYCWLKYRDTSSMLTIIKLKLK